MVTAPSRTHRQHPASGGWGILLRLVGRAGDGRIAHDSRPPVKSGRFTTSLRQHTPNVIYWIIRERIELVTISVATTTAKIVASTRPAWSQ